MINYLNTDCFETMKNLSNIDAIITDIPYGINFHGEKDPDTNWDKFEKEEYKNFLKKFFKETFKVAKNDTIMFVFCAPTKIEDIISVANDWILRPEYTFYYCRAKGRGAKNKLKSLREDILCFTKTPDKKLDFTEVDNFKNIRQKENRPIGYALDSSTGKRVPQYSLLDKSFFITPPTYNSIAEKQIHSCQKPIILFSELIMLSSLKNETIFDPFMGSGASGIAAQLLERNYIGCELDTEMYKKANDWLNKINNPSTREAKKLKEYL